MRSSPWSQMQQSQYVFAHCKQLDFGSVHGPNSQIMLTDQAIIQVLHAHVRVETITEFSVQPPFQL